MDADYYQTVKLMAEISWKAGSDRPLTPEEVSKDFETIIWQSDSDDPDWGRRGWKQRLSELLDFTDCVTLEGLEQARGFRKKDNVNFKSRGCFFEECASLFCIRLPATSAVRKEEREYFTPRH